MSVIEETKAKQEIESGIALHCHHDRLYEFVYSYQERVDYINTEKPEKERALRLRLFKMVPEAMVPGRESKAWAACEKAWDAYAEAWAAYDEAWADSRKALADSRKALAAYEKAWTAYDEWAAYTEKYAGELAELHRQLCPDCPWDGKTIFTDKLTRRRLNETGTI